VHRDIKPANIFLAEDHEHAGLIAKVGDFGIAKLLHSAESSATKTIDGVMCTPQYAAPELLQRAPVPASDLYALGHVMAELLDGRAPYDNDNALIAATNQLRETPVPLGRRAATSPLAGIIRRAVAKPVAERFESAAEMSAAIGALLREHSVAVDVRVTRPTVAQRRPLGREATAPLTSQTLVYTGASRTPSAPTPEPPIAERFSGEPEPREALTTAPELAPTRLLPAIAGASTRAFNAVGRWLGSRRGGGAATDATIQLTEADLTSAVAEHDDPAGSTDRLRVALVVWLALGVALVALVWLAFRSPAGSRLSVQSAPIAAGSGASTEDRAPALAAADVDAADGSGGGGADVADDNDENGNDETAGETNGAADATDSGRADATSSSVRRDAGQQRPDASRPHGARPPTTDATPDAGGQAPQPGIRVRGSATVPPSER